VTLKLNKKIRKTQRAAIAGNFCMPQHQYKYDGNFAGTYYVISGYFFLFVTGCILGIFNGTFYPRCPEMFLQQSFAADSGNCMQYFVYFYFGHRSYYHLCRSCNLAIIFFGVQIIHADITLFRMANNVKVFIYTVVDNCSGMPLALVAYAEKKAAHILTKLTAVYNQYLKNSGNENRILLTDGGSENMGRVKQVIATAHHPAIQHPIA
jgi:hypothetical protein